jgi:hypothetical protein
MYFCKKIKTLKVGCGRFVPCIVSVFNKKNCIFAVQKIGLKQLWIVVP